MATDLEAIVRNLCGSYAFEGKTALSVGAGGGQLIEYARKAERVIAVDNDPAALDALRERLAAKGLSERFEIVEADFFAVDRRADVVLFEFSLHEIEKHEAALGRAKTLAPDVVVLDHAADSRWAYFVDEEEKVEASERAVRGFPARSISTFHAEQHFADYSELLAKVAPQGRTAIDRVSIFRESRERIVIPMSYVVALL